MFGYIGGKMFTALARDNRRVCGFLRNVCTSAAHEMMFTIDISHIIAASSARQPAAHREVIIDLGGGAQAARLS